MIFIEIVFTEIQECFKIVMRISSEFRYKIKLHEKCLPDLHNKQIETKFRKYINHQSFVLRQY